MVKKVSGIADKKRFSGVQKVITEGLIRGMFSFRCPAVRNQALGFGVSGAF